MKWVRHAVKAASRANSRSNHGAVVIRGGRILGIGWNTSRVHNRWIVTQERNQCTFHAEINAIRGIDCRGARVIVVRVRKNGTLAPSRPCESCWRALEAAGVRLVAYS